jgi:hypothetical protein
MWGIPVHFVGEVRTFCGHIPVRFVGEARTFCGMCRTFCGEAFFALILCRFPFWAGHISVHNVGCADMSAAFSVFFLFHARYTNVLGRTETFELLLRVAIWCVPPLFIL